MAVDGLDFALPEEKAVDVLCVVFGALILSAMAHQPILVTGAVVGSCIPAGVDALNVFGGQLRVSLVDVVEAGPSTIASWKNLNFCTAWSPANRSSHSELDQSG